MTFDYDQFINALHQQHKESLSVSQIEELVGVREDYSIDTPDSTGKRLIVDQIFFSGKKKTTEVQPYAGDEIFYKQSLSSGINIWVADNLKGKSSIFKIIRWAFTGDSSLKNNIESWIDQILLNFSISEDHYSIHLDVTGSRPVGSLFRGTFDELSKLEQAGDSLVFSAKSATSYVERIQEFFFSEFSYYALKWTQKASQKDQNKLYESSASWKTYFYSIFLESGDTANLTMGDQGKKIFQMLLGLQYTLPINKLMVKKDMMVFDKALLENFHDQPDGADQNVDHQTTMRLQQVNQELQEISEANGAWVQIRNLYIECDTIIGVIRDKNRKIVDLENNLQKLQSEHHGLVLEKAHIESEKTRLEKEIQKAKRKILDIEEYLEIGIFFSNLDIKHCPSCDHLVTDTKKIAAAHEKKCAVCNDPMDADVEADKAIFEDKLENLQVVLDGLTRELQNLPLQDTSNAVERKDRDISQMMSHRAELSDTNELTKHLGELERQIELLKGAQKSDTEKDKFIAEKAVLEYKIAQQKAIQLKPVINYAANITLLNSAIAMLNDQRYSIGQHVLSSLSELMLQEIHALGLSSITEININEKFDVMYKQDGEFIPFSGIAEGEKLRAKIALYLSLIQLDIEKNFGRHTRFLIIDSPAKEEADDNYINGISTLLKGIEERFGAELQILIGTAVRGLEGIVEHEYITPKDQFVF